jgi:hypothetical protein
MSIPFSGWFSVIKRIGYDLAGLASQSAQFDAVRRSELMRGDLVVVSTRNSIYSLEVVDQHTFSVSGGWFNRRGIAPLHTTITGCTWGSRIIKGDIVAARGMCIEFGNRVVTSSVRSVCVFRYGALN